MEQYRMRTGISHCSFAGCAIVLDIGRDRYWRLGANAATTLDWICARRAGPVAPDQLEHLVAMQLIEPTVTPLIPCRPPLPLPHKSAIERDVAPGRFRLVEAIEVALLSISARLTVHKRDLGVILGRLRTRRARASTESSGDLTILAQRFKQYRRMVPMAGQCLPDTLAFLNFTARRGHFPFLIFGVEAWPFAAHCWAQSDDIVLNDALDHARTFAPILVV